MSSLYIFKCLANQCCFVHSKKLTYIVSVIAARGAVVFILNILYEKRQYNVVTKNRLTICCNVVGFFTLINNNVCLKVFM